jgi:protein involved in polysaccharide export with SLBB domain
MRHFRLHSKQHAVLLAMVCALSGLAQTPASAPQNTPEAKPASAPQIDTATYLLQPEDVVGVVTVNHLELTGDYLVTSDGKINVAGIGEIKVQGMTLSQVAEIIRKQYSTNRLIGLIHPTVSATLRLARMQRIYVLGDVRLPGVFDVKPGWRITEAIAAAGGTVSQVQSLGTTSSEQLQPKDVVVTVIHPGAGSTQEMSLEDVLSGTPEKDPILHAGDVVSVRSKDLITVYVTGNVVRPGAYQVPKDGPDVMKAITMAGGVTSTASTAHISVAHTNGSKDTFDLSGAFQLGQTENIPKISSGDLIMVPELQSKIQILGLVNVPGTFPLPDGKEVRLNDALGMASGYNTKRARLSQVAVVSFNEGKPVRKIYDVGRYFRKGDLAMNPVLHAGDLVYVPETNSPDWNNILTGVVAAATAASGVHSYVP